MPETKRPLEVFLCHASADKPKVRELYRDLRKRGIKPWLDEEDLLPGQEWDVEIAKALRSSDAIIICLSKNSVDKAGYIQREIKFALDKALDMPEGRILLIPIRFEECEVPFRLARYQWVDLFETSGFTKLMRALRYQASQLGRSTVTVPKTPVVIGKDNQVFEKDEQQAIEEAVREQLEKEEREVVLGQEEWEVPESVAQEPVKREAAEKRPYQPPIEVLKPKNEKPGGQITKSRRKLNTAGFVTLVGVVATTCVALIASAFLLNKLSNGFLQTAPTGTVTEDASQSTFTAAARTFQAQLTQPVVFSTRTPPGSLATQSAPTLPPAGSATAVCDLALFVRDMNIPDGTQFAPGAAFTKTWRLRNVGACTWSGYSLVFDSGDQMGALSPQTIQTVSPGQEVDLSVDFTAPATAGSYRSYWRIRNSSGVLIPLLGGTEGKTFFVGIRVTNTP
jgi:hypothetical protein